MIRPSRFTPFTVRAAISGAVLLAAGCAVGPEFVPPDSGVHEVVMPSGAKPGGTPVLSEASAPAAWWTLFNDAQLTDLQVRAQETNIDLQVAATRIEQSRALLGIAAADLQPTVGLGASYSREALSENGKFAALGAPSTASNFWQLGFDASWEVDLWGRARRTSESASASLEATWYDREATRVSLSAEVARTYLQLRGTQAELDIAEQNRVVAERTLGLAESRERNGISTRFETSSAHAQLAAVRSLVPELTRHRSALMNALALLLGAPPRTLDTQLRQAMPLPALPGEVPVGFPSEFARRRPDILRAEAQLHAATADIGVANADFYPRVGLRGRIGLEAFSFNDLDSWDSRFFSIGPTVYLPIFQGGRLTQRLALSEARQKTAALAYRQTVLRAWHEVDDALDAWAAQLRQHTELQIAFAQSSEALRVAERGYQEGASDFLRVLTAQRDLLQSQTALNRSATNATLTLVSLYKSLGGGWS